MKQFLNDRVGGGVVIGSLQSGRLGNDPPPLKKKVGNPCRTENSISATATRVRDYVVPLMAQMAMPSAVPSFT